MKYQLILTRPVLALVVVASVGTAHAQWAFVSGTSSGSSFYASTGVGGISGDEFSATAPPTFDDSWSYGPELHGVGPYFSLSVGDRSGSISSNVDGAFGPGYRFARGRAQIEDVELLIGDPNDPFFTMTFDSIYHEVLMEGDDPANFTQTFQQTLIYDNLQMTYLGNAVSIPTNPPYGTVLITEGKGGPYGFNVWLNDETHAVSIGMSDVPTPGGPLSGAFWFGSAYARIDAALVPEPSGINVVAAGAFIVCFRRRRS